MNIQTKIYLNEFILAMMVLSFLMVGMYIAYQSQVINEIRHLLTLSLAELSNLKVTRL